MTGGDVYTIAGSATGVAGNSGDTHAATAALLNDPQGLAFDTNGNLLIADFGNNQVRMLAAGGTAYGQARTANDIYTIAGQTSGASGTGGDAGPASGSSLSNPYGLAVDAIGDVYIADKNNNRIQEIFAAGGHNWGQSMTANDIYTVAGPKTSGASGDSGDGAIATSALLNAPQGLATDAAGDLFIADTANEQVREVPVATALHYGQKMTANDIYTLAGSTSGTAGDSGDKSRATAALLHTPVGLALDPAGDIYIADAYNDKVREIPAVSGTAWTQLMTADDIYTIAGTGTASATGNGGPADIATIYFAVSTGTDNYGDLYIGDQSGGQLREVTSAAPATIRPAPGLTSALYPAPGSTINGTTYPAGITITQPGGAPISFYPQTSPGACAQPMNPAGGYCVMPLFPGSTLTKNGSASYTFSPSPGSGTWTYSQSLGTLTSVTDQAGNTLTVNSTYPAPGTPTCITGCTGTDPQTSTAITCPATVGSVATYSCQTIISASGRALVIGSDTTGQVTSVTDPAGREWAYAYNGCAAGSAPSFGGVCDLASATDPMTNVTSYTYDTANSSPLLAADLLTTTEPDAQSGYSGPDADPGKDTANAYNPAGQVTSQTDPMGNTTSYSYCASTTDCINAATGTGTVTATTAGNATTYSYQQGVLIAQASWTGPAGSTAAPGSASYSYPDTTIIPSASPLFPAACTSAKLADLSGTSGSLLDTKTMDGDHTIITNYCYDGVGDQLLASGPSPAGGTAVTTSGYVVIPQGADAGAEVTNCTATAEATATCAPASGTSPGPAPVPAGGTVTPPSSAPPFGLTYALYDDDGNQLYTTTGVYSPTGTYEYAQTTYQLYKGNAITLNSTLISCTYTPPSASLPCAVINADGVVTQLQYYAQGDLELSASPDGNSGNQLATTKDTYDSDGEQLTHIVPDGNVTGANAGNYTTTSAYNNDGENTAVTQGNGSGYTDVPRATSYGYDGDGNQSTVKDARGITTTTIFNANDEPTLVTDPDGNATLTCYDAAGDVAETVPPAGVQSGSLSPASCPTNYPADYNPATKAPLASDATMTTYDGSGNTTATYSPLPAGATSLNPWVATTYTYDSDGNLLTTTAPPATNGGSNQVTIGVYTNGQLTAQVSGYGTTAASVMAYCYDPNGDKTSVVYADGNPSGTTVTYTGGAISGLAACSTTSPWTVTSGPQVSYQTTYSYDSAGEMVSTTTPANTVDTSGATTTVTYDSAGNMLTSKDPNGVTTTWAYSPHNLPVSVTYSGSGSLAHPVTYGYDADGSKTGMTDATGSSAYVYDSFGELTSADNGAGQATTYGYNADGQVTGITYPLPTAATWNGGDDTVSYGYDNADELTSVTDFNGHQITLGNTADGLPNSEILGSTGDTVASTYDPTDNPSAITLKNSSTTLQSFTYSNSPAGTILSETDTPTSAQTPAAYTYDAQGRVTSDTPGSGTVRNYAFDASGNLTTLPTGATVPNAGYNDAGELLQSTLAGVTTSYAYNADGEQLTATQGSTATSTATWNGGAGQLTTYSNAAANMTAATYDGNGTRASTTITPSGGSAINQGYVWNTIPQVPQLLMDGTNAYIYDGGLAPQEQVNLSNGAITYLVADALGSVRGTVNSSGALTAATGYDAWGNPLTAGGLTSSTPFGYAGGYTDPDGLLYLLNRYYEPSAGQFISVDPDLAQTLQPFEYADDDPVLDDDPSGMAPAPQNDKCLSNINKKDSTKVNCLSAIRTQAHRKEMWYNEGHFTATLYFSRYATHTLNYWLNIENPDTAEALLALAFVIVCTVTGSGVTAALCGAVGWAVAGSVLDSIRRASGSKACWYVRTTGPAVWDVGGPLTVLRWGATQASGYCVNKYYKH